MTVNNSEKVEDTSEVTVDTLSATCSLEHFLEQSYDFLIAGGGTAGLVLAARLTEDPNVTVGVIEAGKNRLGDMVVDVPAMFTQAIGNPEYEWLLKTTPQAGTNGKVHHMVRGKALGGSSAINYMQYVRGSDADYDNWASLTNDPGWGSSEMRKYFRKHQTLDPIDDSVTDRSSMPFVGENHGTDGPLHTSFNDWDLPIVDDVIKVADKVTGLDKKPMDPWSGDHIGFYNNLGSVTRTGPNKGKRSYSARSYFEPNKDRPNLKVLCEGFVTSIFLEDTKATGINFTYGGQQHKVRANKEVIVCGGVINSPQLLELSGIGDPDVLKAAGVECKVELAGVGSNLQDHLCAVISYELVPGILSLDQFQDPAVLEQAQKTLMEKQGGPLTAIASGHGFIPYTLVASDEEELRATVQSVRDTPTRSAFHKKQLEQVAATLENPKSAVIQMVLIPADANLDKAVEDQSTIFVPPPKPNTAHRMSFTMSLEYPSSRGTVHITSSDPTTQPAIDPQYHTHPADRTLLAHCCTFTESIATALVQLGKFSPNRIFPPPSVDLSDLSQARTFAQNHHVGQYHPIGTCAMGVVVDSRLRVMGGVQGLRVVDASVFPNHVSGNICGTVYAVAEKAADVIKEDYGLVGK